jgi:hypothetical protein
MGGIDESTFNGPDIVFQIGVAPIRIDMLTGIDLADVERLERDRYVRASGRSAIQLSSDF